MLPVSAPEPLSDEHDFSDFDCGVPALNDWLRRRARANEVSGASRTYVLCESKRVVGYFALASGSANLSIAPGRFRRNMPDPIPVAILARLAIDQRHQRQGLGNALFQDAVLRVSHAAHAIGIRGILVHAISAEARAFYEALGFEPSSVDPMTLMIALGDVRKALA